MTCERLKDRVVIVTGAASGIGRATAARLASEGAKVVASDIVADALAESAAEATAAAEASGHGGEVVAQVTDISSEESAAAAVAATVERFGKLDGLANIAGMLRSGRTHTFGLDEWNRIISVNLTGTFLMCREALPHLMESKGAIVNSASTSSSFGHPWMGAYAASKGAIWSFTQTLAVEYCKVPVRANCIAPGSVHSGITSNVEFPPDLTDRESKLVRRIMSPTGFGNPEDVAGVVAMLLSDDARHITGECIRIDGGTHA
ncbi:MAG: SDR family oxidoreductase [Acidimicrobiales bacterium]|nr:SDR family oxidoreductase [Acidimicrobiales bacterium]